MFQILVSTIDNRFLGRLAGIPFDCLVINQLFEDAACASGENVLSYREVGLSRSRNRALDIATGDICLISDDDVDYLPEIDRVIESVFQKNPDADIITFQIQTPDGQLFKRYRNKKFWHNKRTVMSVCSIEIAFKREAVVSAGLRFDERFGLGANFPTGEEIIFLCDALDKKLNVLYYPAPIVIHSLDSSGSRLRNNSNLIEAKGAMFLRIFGIYSYFVSFVFAQRKYRASEFGLAGFYFKMLRGAKQFRRLL